MTATLWVMGVCLVIEAFFSGSEIAVVSADRLKIRQGTELSVRTRRLLQGFLATPQRLLATTLIGTQLAIVTSTVTLTTTLMRRHDSEGAAEWIVLLALTPVLVILGEIVPKSFAQNNADRLAPYLVYPLHAASLVFTPAVWLMVRFTSWIARRLGLDVHGKLVSREDLELIVKGGAQGNISDGERKMISRIFDFGERTAYDVMVPLSSLNALSEDAALVDVVGEIEDKGFTRYPVYRERVDRIVGMLHAFDVLKAGKGTATIGQLMQPPIYATENQPAVDLLMLLQRQRRGMAIVVDEYGGAVGAVTIEDILEEIVGEIEDEFDEAPGTIRRESEGVWRVRAATSIAEVNRVLHIDLPEGPDYETLAGLVLDRLKHIPRVGEAVRVSGATLTVMAASQHAVEEVRVARRR